MRNPVLILPFLFLSFFFFPAGSAGQLLSGYQKHTYLTDFPQNSVQTLFQDYAGYIWIGTEGGLNCYDGRQVISYKEGDNGNFKLEGKAINQITGDKNHHLWIATKKGGINIIDPWAGMAVNEKLAITSAEINKKLPVHDVECIRILRNGKVVIGTDPGLTVYDPATGKITVLRYFEYNNRKDSSFVVGIAEDDRGNCIVSSSNNGVFVFDREFRITRHYSLEKWLPAEEYMLLGLLSLPGNIIYIATIRGLYKIDLNTGEEAKPLQDALQYDLQSARFNCLMYDPVNKHIIAGSDANGVFTLDADGKIIDHLFDTKTRQYLHSNTVLSLLADKNNLGYWVGTRNGLTKFFRGEDKFFSYQVSDPLDGVTLPVYPIYTEDNIHLLTGTNRGLFETVLPDGNTITVPVPENKRVRFNSILRMHAGFYVYATAEGLYYSNSYITPKLKRLSGIAPELKFCDEFALLTLLKISDDEILIGARGTNGGLIRWNKQKKKAWRFLEDKSNPDSLLNNTINFLTRGAAGEFLVCTNQGICEFDTSRSVFTRRWVSQEEPRNKFLNYPQVNALIAEKNRWWIGTYGGGLNIREMPAEKFSYINKTNGLANNDIYAIYRGDGDALWMSTNMGLTEFHSSSGLIRNYDRTDGLINNEYNRTSSFTLRDTIYFGGISGVCYFNLRNMNPDTIAPTAEIRSVTLLSGLNEKPLFPDSLGRLNISYKENTIKLALSSPFYINPGKTVFFYRILPSLDNWVSNGTSNELILSQLSPGEHRVEVRTRNGDGIYSRNIKVLTIIVSTPWYQSVLFRTGLILFFSGLIFLFFRLRIQQFRKEGKIRNQIAADLHDDLGSTLNSVKVYANLAQLEKENPMHLEKVKESTQDALHGIRDIIWILDDKKDTVHDVLNRIRQFAEPLCAGRNIRLQLQEESSEQNLRLKKEEKRNLYLVMKEFINNSIKYADCRMISIQFRWQGKSPVFDMQDDGKGFEIAGKTEGHGIRNMRNRAGYSGYTMEMISSPGNGTRLTLRK
ncbi:MAG: hypothetical protein IPP93_06000 [Chitinophagaceae bacterium]|nr:hypothetical protein [Chitinophagaceae bacterium]